MEQLIAHLLGDYVFQSHWMAENKTKDSRVAFIHAATYLVPFLLLTRSIPALAIMFFTHAAIDRWRLARYVIWLKNFMAPKGAVPSFWSGQGQCSILRRNWDWKSCTGTGYAPGVPAWLSVWLMIITDNTLHMAINYAAIRWL